MDFFPKTMVLGNKMSCIVHMYINQAITYSYKNTACAVVLFAHSSLASVSKEELYLAVALVS